MIAVCAIAAGIVFWIDILTRPGVNDAVLYVAVMLLAAAYLERRATAALATLCTVLVVLGLMVSTGWDPSRVAVVNRGVVLVLIWLTALFFGRVRDIARRALRVAESAPIPVLLADGDGGIVYMNPAAERLFGYARGELEGRDLDVLVPERFRERRRQAFTGFGRDGASARTVDVANLKGVRKDGSEFPLEMQLSALATAREALVLCFLTDVSERHRLDAESEQLSMIRDSSDDAIVATTLDGTVTSWNSAAEQLFGYPAAAAIGRNAAELTVPESRAGEVAAMAKELAASGRMRRFETERKRSDGSLVDVSLSMALIHDDRGRPVGTLTITHDITDRKRAESAMRLARDDLEARVRERTTSLSAANARLEEEIDERHKVQDELRRTERLAAIGTLSAGIAHEINNPLGLIALEVHHAREQLHDPAALSASLGEIEKAVKRCADIVNGVLGFARRQTSQLEHADVNAAARAAYEATRDASRKAGVEVRLDLDSKVPSLLMNPTDVEQVLVNLIDNALYASAPGSEIRVTSACADGHLTVQVRDHGRGMSDEELARACEPFFTTRLNGTGLGLSICHGMVASHGGALNIESAPGEGTTITLDFPIDRVPC
jgi:PAS domain S-box-containing protein